MSDTWAERQVYWATLAYARWWLAVDGPFLGALKRESGFTPSLLRRVAVRYNVNRGLLRPSNQPKGQDAAAEGMIQLLHTGAHEQWPTDLRERAEKCVEIALTAQDENHTGKLQLSGVSKFMWFLKPDRWTLFDQFAAAGMGITPHQDRRRPFLEFYDTLAEGDFDDVVRRIEPVIATSTMPKFAASRILDSLLMARGARGSAAHEIEESRTFLTLIPKGFRDDLHDLASELQTAIGNGVLPPKSSKRKKL